MSKLTALGVKKAGPGRHGDGGGLYLMVSDTGSRKWVLRIQVRSKRRDLGLGSAAKVSLSEAREAAEDMRRAVNRGEDPVTEKRRARVAMPTSSITRRSKPSAMAPVKAPSNSMGTVRAMVISATMRADCVTSKVNTPMASISSQRIIQPRAPAIQMRRKLPSRINVSGVTVTSALVPVSDKTPVLVARRRHRRLGQLPVRL